MSFTGPSKGSVGDKRDGTSQQLRVKLHCSLGPPAALRVRRTCLWVSPCWPTAVSPRTGQPPSWNRRRIRRGRPPQPCGARCQAAATAATHTRARTATGARAAVTRGRSVRATTLPVRFHRGSTYPARPPARPPAPYDQAVTLYSGSRRTGTRSRGSAAHDLPAVTRRRAKRTAAAAAYTESDTRQRRRRQATSSSDPAKKGRARVDPHRGWRGHRNALTDAYRCKTTTGNTNRFSESIPRVIRSAIRTDTGPNRVLVRYIAMKMKTTTSHCLKRWTRVFVLYRFVTRGIFSKVWPIISEKYGKLSGETSQSNFF